MQEMLLICLSKGCQRELRGREEVEVNSKDQSLGQEQALEGGGAHVTAAFCGC